MFRQFPIRFLILVIITLGGTVSNTVAQQIPQVLWTKTFGGSGGESGSSVQQTSDGGFIIAGSIAVDPSHPEFSDVWLIRTDDSGDALWTKTFVGSGYEIGHSVQQASDGGFVIVGQTNSSGAGSDDVWLIRTDSLGSTLWTKTFGGSEIEVGRSVQQTSDGGFIIVGNTYSYAVGSGDIWLIRTDSLGTTLWTKTFGGSEYEIGHAVQQTSDGGFIIVGDAQSSDGDLDVWLIRTDSLGVTDWTLIYDVAGYGDQGRSVQQTSDGGFIVAGDFFSETAGANDVLLIRTDESGKILWTHPYGDGAVGSEFGFSVQQTDDGGFIITGQTSSFGTGAWDLWLIRTDSLGTTLWTLPFGGSGFESGRSVQQTSDGGFIVAGQTSSLGAGSTDVYVIRLGSDMPTTIEANPAVPGPYRLLQNYPNPFNPETTITYSLTESSEVQINIFNALGQLVRTLGQGFQETGQYRVQWSGENDHGTQVSSGIYYYQMVAKDFTDVRKMLMMR